MLIDLIVGNHLDIYTNLYNILKVLGIVSGILYIEILFIIIVGGLFILKSSDRYLNTIKNSLFILSFIIVITLGIVKIIQKEGFEYIDNNITDVNNNNDNKHYICDRLFDDNNNSVNSDIRLYLYLAGDSMYIRLKRFCDKQIK